MGKGKSKRRRAKNAAAAAMNKGKPAGFGPLPSGEEDGPGKKKGKRKRAAAGADEGLPRKLRELIQLKEYAEKVAADEKRMQEEAAGPPSGNDHGGEAAGGDAAGAAAAPQPPGTDAPKAEHTKASAASKGQRDGAVETGEMPAKKGRLEKTLFPEQLPAKTVSAARQKRNDWKKQKKLKKKMKRLPDPAASDSDGEAGNDQQPQVRFGEVAERPPEFNLKQKHWDPEQQAARCTDIFRRQLEKASRAAAKQVSVPDVGDMPAEDATLRLHLIEGYRKNRAGKNLAAKGASSRGPATLQSLKALVSNSAPTAD
mmetsp:Transcript_28253/g.79763  ORF Transcript_28253/g.79763 Transcript_28253/m.79763 type:complete len:313 (-) Transcript_28253:199-1137(-)